MDTDTPNSHGSTRFLQRLLLGMETISRYTRDKLTGRQGGQIGLASADQRTKGGQSEVREKAGVREGWEGRGGEGRVFGGSGRSDVAGAINQKGGTSAF